MRQTLIFFFAFAICVPLQAQQGLNKSFKPGAIFADTDGKHINAHGGGVLLYKKKYYWFGEHKTSGREGNRAQVGVSVYSSSDLYNWKNEGIALKVSEDPKSEIVKDCIIERPKVIYNAKTKKFVMWFHLELKGQGYNAARTGVAISDHVTGPYTYLQSYRPDAGTWPVNFNPDWKTKTVKESDLKAWTPEWRKEVAEGLFLRRDFEKGQMSRDMTVFVDDNGKAYHIHSAEENLTLNISELSDDYTSFTGKWATIAPGGHNEAPAICKVDGKYYLITSGATGWDPNAARSFVANSILGPWEPLGNPAIGEGAELTFRSQSTHILEVPGRKNSYIFMGDRWTPNNPSDGRYIWLPLSFKDGRPTIEWREEWKLEDLTGKK